MGILLRSITCLCLIVGLSIGLAFAQPKMLEEAGLDVYNLPKLQASLTDSLNMGKTLDNHSKQMHIRIEKKTRLIDELIAEKLTPIETRDRLLTLYTKEQLESSFLSLGIEGTDENIQTMKVILHWLHLRHRLSPTPDVLRAIDRVRVVLNEASKQNLASNGSGRKLVTQS